VRKVGSRRLGISRTIVQAVLHELARAGDVAGLQLLANDADVITGADADAAFDRAATKLRDPALALAIAERLAIGSLGEIDYVLCTSDTLRLGLKRLVRFYPIATERVRLELEESGDCATLVFRAASSEAYSRHWREFAVAVIARRIRQTLGRDVRFLEVTFAHPLPPNQRPYAAYFGLSPRFSADADRLGFDRALLDRPLRTAAAALGDLLEARMRDVVPSDGDDALVARVRRIVSMQIDSGPPTLPDTASRIAMSRRSLQRALEHAGTSHQAIVDDVRRRRALVLLEQGQMPMVDISVRLGFSDPRAFFRAFRRWTGTSPAVLRRRPRD
jgi:AraC-like DNA-binding protein